jgi:hypothetical protein
MKNIVGNCIQKRNRNTLVESERQKSLLQVQQDLGFDSGDEGNITTVGVQGKYSIMIIQVPIMNLMMMNERGMNYLT